jgi:hypothetical protein
MTYPIPEGASRDTRLTASARPAALVFDSMADLLAACRRLLRDGYRAPAAAYITHDPDRLYLLLNLPAPPQARLPRRYAYLAEYGREVSVQGLALYLAEYADLIREGDAVEVLGEM